jgi:hypothetical protein
MENKGQIHSFPEWVNTLVNASLTGCVVLVLVTVMGMKEKLIVVEQTMLSVQTMADKDMKLIKQEQKNKDEGQDMAISALERRIETIEQVKAVYGGEPLQRTR